MVIHLLDSALRHVKRREVRFYRAVSERGADPDIVKYRELASEAPYAADVQRARFAKGWTLFALLERDLPVSFAWARAAERQWVGEIDCAVNALRPTLWVIDCITVPEQRGCGHYPRLLRSLRVSVQADELLIYCEASNMASTRGILKAGFEPIGWLRARWGRITASPEFPLGIVA